MTSEATITIYDGILTESGITFLSEDIIAFERARTTVVESPIPIPFNIDVVTASVGHIPSIRTTVGFSVIIPFFKRSSGVYFSSILVTSF